jgi:hypothetical protein
MPSSRGFTAGPCAVKPGAGGGAEELGTHECGQADLRCWPPRFGSYSSPTSAGPCADNDGDDFRTRAQWLLTYQQHCRALRGVHGNAAGRLPKNHCLESVVHADGVLQEKRASLPPGWAVGRRSLPTSSTMRQVCAGQQDGQAADGGKAPLSSKLRQGWRSMILPVRPISQGTYCAYTCSRQLART